MRRISPWLWAPGMVLVWCTVASAGSKDPQEVARHVDRQLAEELASDSYRPAPRTDDATFLRRVFLDITGQPPTADDVLAFLWDTSSDKRSKVVSRLLKDPAYGGNWAAYWRDVIMYRRSEDRAVIASGALMNYLTDAFNANRPWDQIARDFVTATGDVTEEGAAALIMAQNGQPEDTVAEISRIFMGIQIQCAQCHDHPTDQWKREQFHELAAFFPRVAVRPNRDGDKRSFLVVATDAPQVFRNPNANVRFRGTPEHYMPDLDNPQARGTLMQPVFFVSGQSLPLGTKDADRRHRLADWMTSRDNPWFAKAFVNRMWAELCGEGFYEPIDDLGPERVPTAPKTIDYLATEFADSGYDIQWLITVITSTDMYQRVGRSRRSPDDPPFQANTIQPLRGDVLYASLQGALGFQDPPAPSGAGPYGLGRTPRTIFNSIFGYDPSVRRDEVTASIPQAQALMNAPNLAQWISARRGRLATILRDYPTQEDAVTMLYLNVVSRLPSADELRTAREYIRSVGNQGEAMEDLLWALVNSTEFTHRP